MDVSNIDEAILYINKIEDFFDKYRAKPGGDVFYFPPSLISLNDDSVRQIDSLLKKLKGLSSDDLKTEIEKNYIKSVAKSKGGGKIFIGHGRSKLWARLQLYIKDDLLLPTLTFEDESRTSETIINILSQFLDESSFAILNNDGRRRNSRRQN